MLNIKTKKEKKLFTCQMVIVLIYSILIIITVMHHEPWRDEAQAWLISRDIPFFTMFTQMGYEGTPALWHIILAPFAKLGAPYIMLNIINLLIAVFAVIIFVFRSPFTIFTKILFVFSYYMAWEYAIIARNYTISILLLFIIASIYPDRFRKPIKYAIMLLLLFNTNVYSFFISVPLVIIFIYESINKKEFNKRIFIGILIMALGAISSFLQILPPKDIIHGGFFSFFVLKAPLIAIKNGFFPHLHGVLLRIISLFIIILTFIYLFRKSRHVLFFLLFSFIGLFYIFIFKHTGCFRHFGYILVIILFSFWISKYYKTDVVPYGLSHKWLLNYTILILNLSLLVSIVPMIKFHYKEWNYCFSGSKKMARYITENNLYTNIIVADSSPHTSSILPYLPCKKFWYADIEEFGTYVTWNKKYSENQGLALDIIIKRINGNSFSKNKTLLLLNRPIRNPEFYNYVLLYKVDNNIFGYRNEEFYLYKQL